MPAKAKPKNTKTTGKTTAQDLLTAARASVRPVRIPAAANALNRWIETESERHGYAEQERRELLAQLVKAGIVPERPPTLTADLLNALDALDALETTASDLPTWLTTAQQTARVELAAWYPARNLPSPDETEDPGEPQDAAEANVTYPRATAETPNRRLIEYLKCRQSVVYFLDTYAMVAHKQRGIIPFRLWRWQAWLLHQWRTHSRNIVLKGRQIGLSEMALGYATWLALFHPAKTVLFISIGEREAVELLVRTRTILSHLPDWLTPGHPDHPARVSVGKSNTSVLHFTHEDAQGAPYVSSITSLPSTGAIARSLVASLIVLDEWAHQQQAQLIWSGAKDAAGGGGVIIGLSTANGMGNLFHRMWYYANTPEGADDFFPAFLSWRRHPERDDRWYAQEKAEKVANDLEYLLHQEHPNGPLEAFVQSGHNVFSADVLALHDTRIRAEVALRKQQGLPLWEPIDGLTVYEPPVAGHTYVMGVDVAEGLGNGDFDAAVVVDRDTGLQVAELHGHFGPEVYSGYLDQLGYYYDKALLVVERNNHGHTVLLALTSGLAHERWTEQRIAYPQLWHRQAPLVPGARDDRAPGFVTDARTKPIAIDTLAAWLRQEQVYPRSLQFLQESQVFARDEHGRMGAPEGLHDDLVMAFAILVYVLARPNGVEQRLGFLRSRLADVRAAAEVQREYVLSGDKVRPLVMGGSGNRTNNMNGVR